MNKLNALTLAIICIHIITPSAYCAASSQSKKESRRISLSRDLFDPAGLERADQYNWNIQHAPIDELLQQYSTDLPSMKEAESAIADIINRHPWGNQFQAAVKHLKHPDFFKDTKFPTRMLFTGPSGYGKTFAMKAIATYTGMPYLFTYGNDVSCGDQDSATVFLTNLYTRLAQHPDQKFLILLDETSVLAERFHIYDLWPTLEAFKDLQNVCLIATDCTKVEKLDAPIHNFFNCHIFNFGPLQASRIAEIITEQLGPDISEQGASTLTHISEPHQRSLINSLTSPGAASIYGTIVTAAIIYRLFNPHSSRK